MNRHAIRWITIGLMCAVVGAALADTRGQAAKTQANVTAVGRESGAIMLQDGGKKQRFVIVDLDGKTKVLVASDQNVAELHDAVLDEHRKLTADFMAKSKDLIQKQDHAGLKKTEEAYKSASDELLQFVGYCVVEGTLKQQGEELRMQGLLRPFAFKGADKQLAKGKVTVKGEALRLLGKDKKNVLAIRNGDQPILVVGNAADGQAKFEGFIRVIGVLRAGEKGGSPVIEAEKIEK